MAAQQASASTMADIVTEHPPPADKGDHAASITRTTHPTLQPTHARLRAGFASDITQHVAFRRQQLHAIRKFLHATETDHLAALHTDLHKPRAEALVYDIGPVTTDLARLQHCLHRLTRARVCHRELGAALRVHAQPKGVVLILGPFNFPTQLVLRPLIAALAAGNAVLIKPSEHAPASAHFLARLADVLDPRVFACVMGGPDVARGLLHLRWDHVMFTGSGDVGRLVMAAAAHHLTPVTLELGGKCPAVITRSASIETAAASVVRARLTNCGQICLAVDYCLVQDVIYDAFVKAVLAKIRLFYTAHPKTCPTYGRLISSRHLDRLTDLLARSRGKLLHGGDADDRAGHYLAPTVVAVEHGDVLLEQEIFGPILPILRVHTTDEAVQYINARDRPLALYVFSTDRDEVTSVLRRTRSGSVGVNETIFQVSGRGSFIGGVGESGMGAYGCEKGFETFSHFRPVLHSTPFWANCLMMLQPHWWVNKEGKETRRYEWIYRTAARISFPGKGDAPAQEKLTKRLRRAFAVFGALLAFAACRNACKQS